MDSRVITITSGKGGVGKTTTTANLGTALAMQGKKVVVLDGDIGLRNLDAVLGLENRIVYDLVDVVEGQCRLKQALIKDKRQPELYLLPAAQTRDKNAVNSVQMEQLCQQLRQEFDFVVIDSPAGIEQGFRNAIVGADEIIIVANPEMASVRDADRIIGLVEAAGKPEPRLILNRLRPEMVRRGDMMDVADVLEVLGIDLLGVVPEDEQIIVATNKGEPVVYDQQARSGRAFLHAAQRILGEEVPLEEIVESPTLFERLRRLMGFGPAVAERRVRSQTS
jgi:septum site-determining protein MinD